MFIHISTPRCLSIRCLSIRCWQTGFQAVLCMAASPLSVHQPTFTVELLFVSGVIRLLLPHPSSLARLLNGWALSHERVCDTLNTFWLAPVLCRELAPLGWDWAPRDAETKLHPSEDQFQYHWIRDEIQDVDCLYTRDACLSRSCLPQDQKLLNKYRQFVN